MLHDFVTLLSRIGWNGKSAFGLQNPQNPWKGDNIIILKNAEDNEPLPGCSSSTTDTESRNPSKLHFRKQDLTYFFTMLFFYLEHKKLALILCL